MQLCNSDFLDNCFVETMEDPKPYCIRQIKENEELKKKNNENPTTNDNTYDKHIGSSSYMYYKL